MKTVLLLFTIVSSAFPQTWSGSGSNGSDGALNITAASPGVVNGVYIFDPVALNLDQDGDNIYHFTTISIRDTVEVRLKASKMRAQRPVIWLATGGVSIQGRIILNGESGHEATVSPSVRRPSEPGPGGFPGGVGAKVGGVAQPGAGPGGGKVASPASGGCPAAHSTSAQPMTHCNSVGHAPAYGNANLQPLIGGSGGSGSNSSSPSFGSGGGAGGGALRISSSTFIVFGTGVNGAGTAAVNCVNEGNGNFHQYITSYGGDGGWLNGANYFGGAGSGGSVHLQAPVVAGCGTHIYVQGGTQRDPNNGNQATYGRPGRIRIDATTLASISTNPVPALTGPLTDVPLPTNPASIRVSSIAGQNVPNNPAFGYSTPDLTMNNPGAVPIVLAASNIPVNTPVTIYISTDIDTTDVVTTINLTGSVASSSATTNVTLPTGVSRIYVRAVW
ncbi:MAG: hypothetical protein U0R19_36215 [Bryobacteraceae bacterium]